MGAMSDAPARFNPFFPRVLCDSSVPPVVKGSNLLVATPDHQRNRSAGGERNTH
jgi:hypothetical protein